MGADANYYLHDLELNFPELQEKENKMAKQIPCGDFLVAGCKYRCTQQQLDALQKGDELILIREPTNEFDRNAIAIFRVADHIGYVPATLAKHLSPMLAVGAISLCARVVQTLPKFVCKAELLLMKEEEN